MIVFFKVWKHAVAKTKIKMISTVQQKELIEIHQRHIQNFQWLLLKEQKKKKHQKEGSRSFKSSRCSSVIIYNITIY